MRQHNGPPVRCQHGHNQFNAAKCLQLEQKFLARKFDIRNGVEPYAIMDELAQAWDTAALDAVLPCSGDEMLFTDNHIVVKTGLIGCFKDTLNVRAMAGSKATQLSNNSPTRCAQHCVHEGFAYAGVQYGVECYCANGGSYVSR
eukprot:COSAG05_NODE_381_length_10519_cov_17.942131_5_plen_144_part_00